MKMNNVAITQVKVVITKTEISKGLNRIETKTKGAGMIICVKVEKHQVKDVNIIGAKAPSYC
jgi:hypothetical protein